MDAPAFGNTRRVTRRLLLALVPLLLVASPALAADPGPYVALGDSYTAAPLVPNQVGMPTGCARSDHNYPSLVARSLGVAAFTDVSCSSAETVHMTAPQSVLLGTNAPQFGALRAATQLVTVGIGGNDVGLVGAALTCAQLGLTAPTGTACRSHFTDADGSDRLSKQIAGTAPKIAAVLQGIQARSPLARIVLVGYPDVLPRTGSGCWPLVPLSADDVRYFDGLIVQTNQMLATQAAAAGAEFADTYGDSVGHDVCTLPGTRWFEGVVPTAPAYPLHPNGLGMKSMARTVTRILSAPRPMVRGKASRGKRAIARSLRGSARR
jgi:lysophospholipase L1-like esterase